MKQLFVLITILFIVPQTTIAQSNQPHPQSGQSLTQANQSLTQTIRGTVTDKSSGSPIPGATILLDATRQGTTTGDRGQFTLSSVAIDRHTVSVSFIGYETALVKEILLTSAREVYLEIALTESTMELSEVVVRPEINKSASLNKMALLGAQTFSVEEASRFAGGMDDPARLVSSYAGVAAPSGSSNGISVHGNAPSLLQWRVEDIEVPNPNHFADINGLGGGFLAALSSNVLGNSDFFTGAFPAEYNNAVSGIFDLKLRNGNNQKYQHTFQAGLLGIDLASEGPFSKKHRSSYIINYRYSTTSLLEKLRGKDLGGTLDYQDLNLKLHFPTRTAGIFTFWAIGLTDKVAPSLEDASEWKYYDDGLASGYTQKTGAAGLSNRYYFANGKTSLKTTLAFTYNSSNTREDLHDTDDRVTPETRMKGKTTNLVFTSAVNHKFSARHTNHTGFTLTHTSYDMYLDHAEYRGQPLINRMNTDGSANLISVYTSSCINISERLALTLGLNGQFFTLNNHKTIEPRLGLKWLATARSSFAFGYGLHSRMEKPDVYFVKDGTGNFPNRKLDFIKSHHFTLSYVCRISDDMSFKAEPYFQSLYDVLVTPGGTYSILNRQDFYTTDLLVSQGKGRNYGIDLTFEKYLTKGLYYMVTASVFDSKYRAIGGKWYNTRFNRNFIANGLVGKEWMLGRNLLGINLKATVMGGQRYTPADEEATFAHPAQEVQYDENQSYAQQFSPMFLAGFSVNYQMNRKRVSHEFAIKGVNATNQEEYIEHKYNFRTNSIEPFMRANSLFNITYRLEF